MNSILRTEDNICYLCELLNHNRNRQYTEEHHIFFGTANRKLSEKYGLKVNLCLYHHRHGSNAVHNNSYIDMTLKKEGQKAFIMHWPDMSFQEIFGKNYLEKSEIAKIEENANKSKEEKLGFTLLPEYKDHIMERFMRVD